MPPKTRSMTTDRILSDEGSSSASDDSIVVDVTNCRKLTWWNIGLGVATVVLLTFTTVRYTMSRELQELENVIKDMDQAYFQNLTDSLSIMYSQLKKGMKSQGSIDTSHDHRLDHAQFSEGAKIIRFSGDELAIPKTFGDRTRLALGFVPKGACRILGKRLNKNKFLSFKGDRAKLLIEVHQPIFLDTFKIEHYIANLNDTDSIGMMPRNLLVSGLRKSTKNPIILGKLEIELNPESNIQSSVLQISDPKESFEWYQVEVLNNHGNRDQTRMYKIRMYGSIDESK